jgi:hypothetical protein
MTTTIETHCETVLDSPYSRDRQSAIQELGRVYLDADPADRDRILETLRQVALEGSARDDRELAHETLLDCFEADASGAAPVVVGAFQKLATEATLSEERLEAIDSLRKCYPEVDEQHRSTIGSTLADIAGNATYQDERERARRRLSDVSRHERETATETDSGTDAAVSTGYLGQLLAQHLENAAEEGPGACRQQAEEAVEFLVEHPVDDGAYDELVADAESLVDQLEVIPTDGSLDEDRIGRVEGLAARLERLYARN